MEMERERSAEGGLSGRSPRGLLKEAWRSSPSLRGLSVLLGGLALLEILAYGAGGAASFLASRIWALWGAGAVLATLGQVGWALREDLRRRRVIPLLFLGVLVSLLLWLAGDLGRGELSYEAALQAAAGLRSFEAPDWNYTGKAFLGYPNRQYLVAALPTLVLGRTVLALHLGFALPFLVGLGALYAGCRSWAERRGLPTDLSVAPLGLLLAFPILGEYTLIFEQTLLPVALTLGGIGWLLLVLDRFRPSRVLALAWYLCFLVDCYTPALASAGLFLLLLVLAAEALLRDPRCPFLPRKEAPVLAGALLVTAATLGAFGVATILGGRGDRVLHLREASSVLRAAAEGWGVLLRDRPVPFSGVLRPLVLLYLAAAAPGRLLGRGHALVAWWILGVFGASTALAGYAVSTQVMVQRAMVTIPVLCVALVAAAAELGRRVPGTWRRQGGARIASGLLAAGLAVCLGLFVHQTGEENRSMVVLNYVQPLKQVVRDLSEEVRRRGLPPEAPLDVVWFTGSALQKNLEDYLAYFLPRARVLKPEGETWDPGGLDGPVLIYSDRGVVPAPGVIWAERTASGGKRGGTVRFHRAFWRMDP